MLMNDFSCIGIYSTLDLIWFWNLKTSILMNAVPAKNQFFTRLLGLPAYKLNFNFTRLQLAPVACFLDQVMASWKIHLNIQRWRSLQSIKLRSTQLHNPFVNSLIFKPLTKPNHLKSSLPIIQIKNLPWFKNHKHHKNNHLYSLLPINLAQHKIHHVSLQPLITPHILLTFVVILLLLTSLSQLLLKLLSTPINLNTKLLNQLLPIINS